MPAALRSWKWEATTGRFETAQGLIGHHPRLESMKSSYPGCPARSESSLKTNSGHCTLASYGSGANCDSLGYARSPAPSSCCGCSSETGWAPAAKRSMDCLCEIGIDETCAPIGIISNLTFSRVMGFLLRLGTLCRWNHPGHLSRNFGNFLSGTEGCRLSS
jgi:hypothetical protein